MRLMSATKLVHSSAHPVRQQQRRNEEGVVGADAQVHSVAGWLARVEVIRDAGDGRCCGPVQVLGGVRLHSRSGGGAYFTAAQCIAVSCRSMCRWQV